MAEGGEILKVVENEVERLSGPQAVEKLTTVIGNNVPVSFESFSEVGGDRWESKNGASIREEVRFRNMPSGSGKEESGVFMSWKDRLTGRDKFANLTQKVFEVWEQKGGDGRTAVVMRFPGTRPDGGIHLWRMVRAEEGK